MIQYKKGDLFTSNAKSLAHGCNTAGRMGAGIAKQFKKRYHAMYKEYIYLCGLGKFDPGSGFVFKTTDNKFIFNLATQDSLSGAQIEYVESAFQWLKKELIHLNISSFAMPKIGCGLGGLDWSYDVLPILEKVFGQEEIIIEVWDL